MFFYTCQLRQISMGNTGSRVQPVTNDAQQATDGSDTSPLSQQAEQQDPAYLDDLVDAHATANSNISLSTAPDPSAKKKPFRLGLKRRGLFSKKQQQPPSQPIFIPTQEQRLEAELAAANAKVAALTSEMAAAEEQALQEAEATRILENTLLVEQQRSAGHKAQVRCPSNSCLPATCLGPSLEY